MICTKTSYITNHNLFQASPFPLRALPSCDHFQPVHLRHFQSFFVHTSIKVELVWASPPAPASLSHSPSLFPRCHSTEAVGQMFAIPLTLLASSAAPNVGAGASPSWSSPIFEPRCWHSTQQGRTWQVWNRVKWVQSSNTFICNVPTKMRSV